MIQTLLKISSFILLFVSCKAYVPSGALLEENKLEMLENNYFSSKEKDYIYRANVQAYGNTFGGIFIVKKIDEDIHRVVLTTDFGFKMLDVEVSQSSFEIHFIIEQLNRKAFKKTLEEDFKILLKPSYKVYETYKSERLNVFKSKFNKQDVFVFYDQKNKSIEEIKLISKSKVKTSFSFNEVNSTFAKKITINHNDLDLIINLTQYQN